MDDEINTSPLMASRFRGFLPIVVDVETAGFDAKKHALLEIAAVTIEMDDKGMVHPGETIARHVEPYPGLELDPAALAFTGIDPDHPFRMAKSENDALRDVFLLVRQAVKRNGCTRAVLVGHNAFFDLGFVNAAVERNKIKRNPFHPFTSFDTATLGGLAYGQTVLARAAGAAGIEWNESEAHSAIYDAERTAELFCAIVNRWRTLSDLQVEI
jgi:ribonuclease T